MLATICSGAVIGIEAVPVEVEVDIRTGLPFFSTVGLAETSVKESKERVKAALINSGYTAPNDRITVNLAPADIKKEGTGFDLPIAIGILAAMELIVDAPLSRYLMVGELSLDGRIKPVPGTLPLAIAARKSGFEGVIVPADNAAEAGVVDGIKVLGAAHLADVVNFLMGEVAIPATKVDLDALFSAASHASTQDFCEVHGQEYVKRALEVACAGGHNVLMLGPPGSGKTMLAKRLPTILPPLSFGEALDTTAVYSVAGLLKKGQSLLTQRPFRTPHHTVSDAGLIGGGRIPKPGEVSLAHNGVLFLDELPEFKKQVLEVLRQPMEDGVVTISRAAISMTYPANFMLVAAMNPCPCGHLGDTRHECRCGERLVRQYRSRISGPLLDRLDIHVEVPAVAYKDLASTAKSEPSSALRQRVAKARSIQQERFARLNIHTNAAMQNRHVKKFCEVDAASMRLLEAAVDKLGLSARAYNRVLKIARTIADLAGESNIRVSHISEAIQYRTLDRAA